MLDGQEVYFHKNSVVDGDFYKLEVRLVIAEDEGVKGAQARTVIPIGKASHRGVDSPPSTGWRPHKIGPVAC